MHINKRIIYILSFYLITGCSSLNKKTNTISNNVSQTFNYLALGDSYTKGESVCSTCGFPSLLSKSIQLSKKQHVQKMQIAETGWTTTQLKQAIEAKNLASNFDLVTLLIGVNNQFQGKPFSLYEQEFVELLNTALKHAGGNTSKVIVLSIPDYGFTPYGEGSGKKNKISEEIDAYNTFARKTAEIKNIKFINITDITRKGLEKPNLVADDGLHPSKATYQLVTERILKHLGY